MSMIFPTCHCQGQVGSEGLLNPSILQRWPCKLLLRLLSSSPDVCGQPWTYYPFSMRVGDFSVTYKMHFIRVL